jgi:3-deoxy-D-manno-octulosonate 8-phosphate phosphatase (KDO 8-P phosphatase)
MSDIQKKAQSIRLLILDVDGVLTNGTIYYGTDGIELKGFHIHDGMGIKLLQKAGIPVAIISGKNSEPVARRLQDLNVEHVFLGHTDKLPIYESLKQKLGFSDQDIAYVGDDLPDLPLLRRTGLAITVPGAPALITEHVDYITKNSGGAGAVREVCELILKAQNKYEIMVESYLQ